MDDELSALERAHAADPRDPVVAERYASALRRAGRDEDLRKRFEVKFRCTRTWETLTPTEFTHVRHCDDCKQPVYQVHSAEQLKIHVREKRCVAVVSTDLAERLDAVAAMPGANFAQDDDAPCIVGQRPPPQRAGLVGKVVARLSPVEEAVFEEANRNHAEQARREQRNRVELAYVPGVAKSSVVTELTRAEALLATGASAQGLAHFVLVLGRAPEARGLLEQRAHHLESTGDLPGARRALSGLIAASPRDAALLGRRGCLRAMGGDPEGARADFNAAQTLGETRAALWRAAFFGVDDPLRALARGGEKWPAPVARFMLGELSADELLALAKGEQVATAQLLVAHAAQSAGDASRTRALYERCAASAAAGSVELTWARAWLGPGLAGPSTTRRS